MQNVCNARNSRSKQIPRGATAIPPLERALYSNTTGSSNTANGNSALANNITGNYNTVIGYVADVNAANLHNATAIGYNARATSSNQVGIGNSSVTGISGHVVWTTFSDKRTKRNIRQDVQGLAFINRLQPVTFNLDLDAMDGLLKIDKMQRQGEDELSRELKDISKKAREAKEKVKQTLCIDVQDIDTATVLQSAGRSGRISNQ